MGRNFLAFLNRVGIHFQKALKGGGFSSCNRPQGVLSGMTRWNESLSRYLTTLILREWEKEQVATLKAPSHQVEEQVHHLLMQDLQKEKDLEQEVHALMDDLEKSQSTPFQRSKMYPLLKKKLAQKKGIIL